MILEDFKIAILPYTNNQNSYQQMIRDCQILTKSIYDWNNQLVYNFNYRHTEVKVWNGKGISLESNAANYLYKNKDIILIISYAPTQLIKNRNFIRHRSQINRAQIFQSQIEQNKNFPPLNRCSIASKSSQFSSYTRYIRSLIQQPQINKKKILDQLKVNYEDMQIAQRIRKFNKKCIIGFVYIYQDNNQHENQQSCINLLPIFGNDQKLFQILISNPQSCNSDILKRIIDQIMQILIGSKNTQFLSSKFSTHSSYRLSAKGPSQMKNLQKEIPHSPKIKNNNSSKNSFFESICLPKCFSTKSIKINQSSQNKVQNIYRLQKMREIYTNQRLNITKSERYQK